MNSLQYAISYILEPVSYTLFCVFLVIHCLYDKRASIKIVAGYYFLATLLLIKATFFIDNGSNIETYSLLYLITSFFLGIYFYMTLTDRWKKAIVIFLCLVEAGYYIFSNIFYPGVLFDSVGYVILSTGVMIMVFLYMHQILTNVKEEQLSLNFDFWFVSSQMVYHFGSFVIFLTFSYLTKKIMPSELYSVENRTLLVRIWGIHNVLLFLSSLLTCGSIVWIAFHRKSPSSS